MSVTCLCSADADHAARRTAETFSLLWMRRKSQNGRARLEPSHRCFDRHGKAACTIMPRTIQCPFALICLSARPTCVFDTRRTCVASCFGTLMWAARSSETRGNCPPSAPTSDRPGLVGANRSVCWGRASVCGCSCPIAPASTLMTCSAERTTDPAEVVGANAIDVVTPSCRAPGLCAVYE
jgi:hypothetical protein